MRPLKERTGNSFVDQLDFYQAANSNSQTIKSNFVVRHAEFQLITNDLKNKKANDPLQHELILGRRGSGKSTLLKRIQIAIEEEPSLSQKYIVINTAEEQAAIFRLFDLWIEVLKELSIKFDFILSLNEYDDFDDEQSYTRYLYSEIRAILKKEKKKAVLLLDNLDRILGNFNDDGHLLRETLLNHNDLQIIGGSTRMDEHFWKYDKPFYEFFRTHRLEGLSSQEIHELLHHWSNIMDLPELANFTKNNPGKIEALRILTDGLPRTLQFFINILLQNSSLYGFEYIKKIMSDVTPLYQERLNYLPAAHRKIVQEMAFLWEACSARQLAEKCRMESKLVSAYLKQLSDNGIVETIMTPKKNHLYRLAERFFNMWLIVTQGNPEQKRKAKWLSIFLETWYDAKQLKALTLEHLKLLKVQSLPYDRAIILTKAFSQSRYTSTQERDEMLDHTSKLNRDSMYSQALELPKKYADIEKEVLELIRTKKTKNAHQLVDEIENEEDGVKFYLQAFIYFKEKKDREVEKYLIKAVEKGHVAAPKTLADQYRKQGKIQEAEKYYLEAIKKEHVEALNNLAILYKEQGKIQEAEKYYLKAIEKEHVDALNNLAILYKEQGKIQEAEKYYLKAIEKGNINALNNLAILYKEQGKIQEAERYYLKAMENGDVDALYNLAILYEEQGKIQEAEKYYLKAIEKEDVDALNNLAILYKEQGKIQEAEKYYLKAIEKGNINALYNLAVLYKEQGKIQEAEKYYLEAIEKGNMNTLNNLAILYEEQGKIQEAEKYYRKSIENGHINALYNLAKLFYETNTNKKEALHLITEHNRQNQGQTSKDVKIIFEIWNAEFEKVEENLYEVLENSNYENLEWLIQSLVVHDQLQMVSNLFGHEIHGKTLQDRYTLLYYAFLLLAKDNSIDNLDLRIPPEVDPTVHEIVEYIKQKRTFYYS